MTWPDQRRRLAILALAVASALVIAACGDRAPTSPVTSVPDVPAPSIATDPPGSTRTASAGETIVDPGLLALLPASIDGVAMQPQPETAAGTTADAALGRSASAIAVGGYFAPGNSGSDNLAVASVVQLRPDIFDDAFYTTWRADYDTAACAPAGGVASHASRQIGANAVELTVCAGGARTYQTHLAGDILVSVTDLGARSFGERVMAGLRQ